MSANAIEPATTPRPRMDAAVVALLLVGLGLRLAWALTATTDLWFDHVFNDATAWSIAQGRGFTASVEPPYDPAIFRTPGYAAFLGAVYFVFGHAARLAFVANALLDAASCWLLWRLAVPRVGASAAKAALLLAVTYPFTMWSVGQVSPESLAVFGGLVLVALMERWPAAGGWGRVVAVGVVAGALAWIKPVFLPLPAFVLLAERLRGRTWRTAFARAVVVGVVSAVLFAPWVVRNHREFGRPVLAGELGLVVWHGTHDFHEERDEMIQERFESQPKVVEDRYEATRKRFTNSPKLLESDARFLRMGLENVRARPWHAFLLDPLRRVPRLWVSTTYTLGPRWVGLGAMAACIGYLLLAAVGAWRLRRRLAEMAAWWVLPVQLTLVYAALHVEARYTLPARPSLLLLAAVGLAFLWRRLRGRAAAEPPRPAR